MFDFFRRVEVAWRASCFRQLTMRHWWEQQTQTKYSWVNGFVFIPNLIPRLLLSILDVVCNLFLFALTFIWHCTWGYRSASVRLAVRIIQRLEYNRIKPSVDATKLVRSFFQTAKHRLQAKVQAKQLRESRDKAVMDLANKLIEKFDDRGAFCTDDFSISNVQGGTALHVVIQKAISGDENARRAIESFMVTNRDVFRKHYQSLEKVDNQGISPLALLMSDSTMCSYLSGNLILYHTLGSSLLVSMAKAFDQLPMHKIWGATATKMRAGKICSDHIYVVGRLAWMCWARDNSDAMGHPWAKLLSHMEKPEHKRFVRQLIIVASWTFSTKPKAFKSLLEHPGIFPDRASIVACVGQKNHLGQTLLHILARSFAHNYLLAERIQILMNAVGDAKSSLLEEQDKEGQTAMMIAKSECCWSMCFVLFLNLDHPSQVLLLGQVLAKNQEGRTPMHDIFERNDHCFFQGIEYRRWSYDFVRKAIEMDEVAWRSMLHAKDTDGRTAFVLAKNYRIRKILCSSWGYRPTLGECLDVVNNLIYRLKHARQAMCLQADLVPLFSDEHCSALLLQDQSFRDDYMIKCLNLMIEYHKVFYDLDLYRASLKQLLELVDESKVAALWANAVKWHCFDTLSYLWSLYGHRSSFFNDDAFLGDLVFIDSGVCVDGFYCAFLLEVLQCMPLSRLVKWRDRLGNPLLFVAFHGGHIEVLRVLFSVCRGRDFWLVQDDTKKNILDVFFGDVYGSFFFIRAEFIEMLFSTLPHDWIASMLAHRSDDGCTPEMSRRYNCTFDGPMSVSFRTIWKYLSQKARVPLKDWFDCDRGVLQLKSKFKMLISNPSSLFFAYQQAFEADKINLPRYCQAIVQADRSESSPSLYPGSCQWISYYYMQLCAGNPSAFVEALKQDAHVSTLNDAQCIGLVRHMAHLFTPDLAVTLPGVWGLIHCVHSATIKPSIDQILELFYFAGDAKLRERLEQRLFNQMGELSPRQVSVRLLRHSITAGRLFWLHVQRLLGRSFVLPKPSVFRLLDFDLLCTAISWLDLESLTALSMTNKPFHQLISPHALHSRWSESLQEEEASSTVMCSIGGGGGAKED